MENAHKQRLVGGAVLLALALILVPTILDFSQEESEPAEQMPAAPDAMQMEVLPLEIWSEPVAPKVDTEAGIIEQPTPPTAAATPEPAPVPAQPPAPATPKPAPAADSAPALPQGASGWAVQVASFSDEPKAFALRDRLREAGHPVFIERGRSGGSAIYRVKVGPVLQRSEADRLKAEVDKQTGLTGLVMQYR